MLKKCLGFCFSKRKDEGKIARGSNKNQAVECFEHLLFETWSLADKVFKIFIETDSEKT